MTQLQGSEVNEIILFLVQVFVYIFFHLDSNLYERDPLISERGFDSSVSN